MRKIKKISKSIFSILLALLITVTTMPLTGIQFIYTINAQNVYQDNEKIDDSDIFYADATFVNYDSVAWTFINQCIRGTWMYIKSYRNSNMLMQPSNYDGTYTHLWDDGGAYKQWIFIPENDYFYIQNANTGKYLWFGELREGAEVNVSTPSDGRGWNNRFKLVTDQRASTFSIRPYADTNYCVEISGRDTSIPQQQDKIQIWTYYGYQNQLWNIHVDNPNLLNDTLIYNVQNNPQGTNAYNYPLSGIVPGMVQDTIDNMNLKFNNIYTAYDLFGNVDSNTKYGSLSVYQEVNTDYKFPFKIDSDGYRTFDSANMYVVKNDTNKKFDLYNGGYRTWWHDVTSQYEKAIDNAFLPYNTPQNSSEMDYGFTMCMNIKFYMESDGKVHIYDENGNETEQSMIFEFTGDDDLWIYIDNDLRLDMGGIHGPKSGSINFDKSAGGGSCVAKTLYDNGAVNTESKFNLSSGVHELKIFYMERAQTDSNLKVRYNLISKNNLKIDPNGGTYRNKAEVIDLGEQLSNKKLQIYTPKRTGYTFKGWNIKGTGRMSADNIFYFMGYNDTTLVAQWEPNQYNLNFDYNKPQDAAADVTNNDIITKKVSYTKKVGELPEPHLDGYTFTGWKDAEGNTYTEDTVYNVLGDTTLYAQWQINNYKIIFDYNCDPDDTITGNEIKTKPGTYGKAVGELPKPQITGKNFGGWYRESDGKIIFYNEKSLYDVDGDMTLKASWSAEQLNVFYHGNGGSYDYEDTLSYTYSYGSKVEILENQFLYDGDGWYEFGGWALTPDGTVKYSPGDYIDIDNDIDLYAVWKPLTAEVKYHSNGGTGSIDPYKQMIEWNSSFVTAENSIFEKQGYVLTGWSKSSSATKVDYKCGQNVLVTDDVFDVYNGFDLYAVWKAAENKLYFDYNKPGEAAGDITGNEILSKPVIFNEAVGELPEPQLTGWLFTGWKDADGKIYTKETVYNVAGDTTLYAQWSRNIYTLYFDYNKPEEAAGDITGNEISSKPVTFNEMVGELPHPQLDKYTFLSWKDADGNIYTEDTVFVLSQDLTLYAFWDAAPVINAIDRYYSLNNAKNGKVTYDNLMTTASVNDDLDKPEDIDFTIIDYAERDFNTLTASAEITITYRAVDSAGNSSMKMITVHITDTSSVVKKKNTYVRSISEKYYNKSHEDGGLEPNSIWRINSEYAAVLQDAMENKASISYNVENFRVAFMNVPYTNYKNMTCNHILSSWKFTHEDIKKVQNFIDEHGCGNFKESDALSRFIQEFSYCRQY